MKYTEKQINKFLNGIYDGSITVENLPEDLYHAIAEHLREGVYKGFGATLTTADETDLELLAELRGNVYMFAAAKTYQEVKDISSMVADAENERDFNRMGRAAYDNWNDNYGATEYNTAVLQAQNSVKWAEIERNKEAFPNLRYSTIGDACDICEPLNDLVAPVGDPIWDTIYPENHFNCRCVVMQEDADTPVSENKDEVFDKVQDKMNDNFKNNAGKTGQVFTKDHPYFQTAPKAAGRDNFGLQIPETDD